MTTGSGANSYGFEWRTLLGPTHNWPAPIVKVSPTKSQRDLVQYCELCGEPVGAGKPFTTNSAGQRAMHLACLGDQEPIKMEPQGARGIWERWQQIFAGVSVLQAYGPPTCVPAVDDSRQQTRY